MLNIGIALFYVEEMNLTVGFACSMVDKLSHGNPWIAALGTPDVHIDFDSSIKLLLRLRVGLT